MQNKKVKFKEYIDDRFIYRKYKNRQDLKIIKHAHMDGKDTFLSE